jgi:hypothetical protein
MQDVQPCSELQGCIAVAPIEPVQILQRQGMDSRDDTVEPGFRCCGRYGDMICIHANLFLECEETILPVPADSCHEIDVPKTNDFGIPME